MEAFVHGLAIMPGDVDHLSSSIATYGFGSLPSIISGPLLRALDAEARERDPAAAAAQSASQIRYSARMTALGPVGRALLFSRAMTALLLDVFGERFLPNEGQSCLTFYGEGDHLGPHVDQPAAGCVVTAIAYVATRRLEITPQQTGMQLRVYGKRITPDAQPLLCIPTETGTLVLGRGSVTVHERPMLQKGEYVAAITGCYMRAAA